MGAFPNAELKAEQGYNAELGFKQGYKFGNLKGFIDVAGFYTRYKDMIEFRFGLFNNKTFDYIDGLSKLFNAFSSGDGRNRRSVHERRPGGDLWGRLVYLGCV